MEWKIQDRLRAYISHKKLTYKDFEGLCGLSGGAAAKIGETVRKSTIKRISEAFPDLSTTWLLTGEGEMLRTPPASTVMRVGNNNSGQVAQGGSSISSDNGSAYLEIIREQQRQMSKMQEQYDRLLGILEKMQQNGSG